jgi:hypothetical protein
MNEMRAVCIIAAVFVGGCGGSTEEPKVPQPEPEARQKAYAPPTPSVSQELGTIDADGAQRTWNDLQPRFDACRRQGMQRVEYLHGDVKFFVRVGPDGRTRWTYFEDSTIGDRDTESCFMDAVKAASWPKPTGGDAEVRNSFGFDPEGRAPASWSVDRIASILGKNDKDLLKCKKGLRAEVHVTMYVEPHKKEGKVQAAGASVPAKDADEKIDCILNEVRGWKLPSPGSWGAKVEFRI